jgi:integrase
LVKNGTPLYEVAKLLGHSTIQMTQRYAHLAPDNLRRAVAGLEGALEEKSATVLPFAGKAST